MTFFLGYRILIERDTLLSLTYSAVFPPHATIVKVSEKVRKPSPPPPPSLWEWSAMFGKTRFFFRLPQDYRPLPFERPSSHPYRRRTELFWLYLATDEPAPSRSLRGKIVNLRLFFTALPPIWGGTVPGHERQNFFFI